MRIEITNQEVITIAKMEEIINPSSENEISELRRILKDSSERSRFVRMWNEARGIVINDKHDSFEVEINFAPLGANGVLDFTIELIKDVINEFMPDYKSGKLITKYAERKLEAFGKKWTERCAQLGEKLRKPNEELFNDEQLKLIDEYMNFRCQKVLAHPEMVALPPVTDPEFGVKYSEFVKSEKEFLRSIGLGRVHKMDGTLETLESFCACAK